jgi:hypothetical protein
MLSGTSLFTLGASHFSPAEQGSNALEDAARDKQPAKIDGQWHFTFEGPYVTTDSRRALVVLSWKICNGPCNG